MFGRFGRGIFEEEGIMGGRKRRSPFVYFDGINTEDKVYEKLVMTLFEEDVRIIIQHNGKKGSCEFVF